MKIKKIFNIFLTTFIVLLASLLFSKVNAEKIAIPGGKKRAVCLLLGQFIDIM